MEEELPVKYQWLEDLGKARSLQQIRSKKLDTVLGFNGPTFFMQKISGLCEYSQQWTNVANNKSCNQLF